MWLPMFPLESIFFPGELVHLHIFEDRYKELIRDVKEEDGVFGIPVYISGAIALGTEMKLEDIVATYEDGKLDVICSALRVFIINSFQNKWGSKKYAGGEVSHLPFYEDGSAEDRREVVQLVSRLYQLMGADVLVNETENLDLHIWVHKIGLSLNQEYRLLQMTYESDRLRFLRKHLRNMIMVLMQVDSAKEMIGMNGHFKRFDPLDFKNFKF
ncbi:LON peptidase substrate-binding domain-containing protein [Arenibacter latericius]|uniref:LON peptidase substrate-binding domain-containing protein n=1 Tax=Arenibacter latericius TaxID=86104 RepID=UPI000426257A|nr:LON peptidase substrate-binding domain-containing protein [Arenibacter latericius]